MTELPLSKPTATVYKSHKNHKNHKTMSSEASSLDSFWMPFTANRQFRQQPHTLNINLNAFTRGLPEHGVELADALLNLKDLPNVIDIRNTGLVAAIELAPEQGKPGERGYKTFIHAYENGVLVRWTGDILAISPPLIIEPDHIDQLVSALREGILFSRRSG